MRSAKLKRQPTELPVASDKREQILQGAMQVFLNQGYAATSMDRVATTAGVSKQTIYSHFQDKEGLFTALIQRVTLDRVQHHLGCDQLSGEPSTLLRRLAEAFLHEMSSEEYLNLLRIILAESLRFPELAQLYSRTVIQKGRQILSSYLQSHPELPIADPEAAAHIFMGTLVSFLISQEILYGKLISPLSKERVVDQLVALIVKS